MTVLEHYLSELVKRRTTTVAETAHYDLLKTLIDAAGDQMRPHVTAWIHPRDTGVGIPDMGLFDENQTADILPMHGVVEAKPVRDDLLTIANSEQVKRYLGHYDQVLVTNYYQFVLVTQGANNRIEIEARYNLAENESAFWAAAAHPQALAAQHEAALNAYLMQVMRRKAKLTKPQEVAKMLASYAREAKARLSAESTDSSTLIQVREQLEAALGVRFEGEEAGEFFRSTLVQTLFYGVFSAWVLWHEGGAADDASFEWIWQTRRFNVPVVKELFEKFSAGSQLPEAVEKVLNWTGEALNRVDRNVFFEGFKHGGAVQYFYEPFLEAFDPELRRQLGVWYTPPEVVEYMVARVDAALIDELGIVDGLADPNVYVLDPCCGTGAYLVAVLRRIYERLKTRVGELAAAQETQKAMRERVFGFEILPAPFVVAHLQLGILLSDLHAPMGANQRAGVYLTNALTGWGEAPEGRMKLLFPELEQERKAADTVKQERDVLVILGNPPYDGFTGVAIDEERDLTTAYRTVKRVAAPQGQGLNDLYIRFYRMAERRIVENTGRGVVSFISNYSWLGGLSHPGMREKYLDVFDSIYIDNLHGDRIISEYAPDGRSSETVFAMRGSSPGIKVGTQIATLVRKPNITPSEQRATLYYRDMNQSRADERRAALLASLQTPDFKAQYQTVKPSVEIGLPFKPHVIGANYFAWAKLTELFPVSFPGVKTSHDDVVVDVDKERLIERVKGYIVDSQNKTLSFKSEQVVKYAYRPFDVRWLYWDVNILDRPRPEYFPHVQPENMFLFTTGRTRKDLIEAPIFTHLLNDLNLMDSGARGFPLYLYPSQQPQLGLFESDPTPLGGRKPNLSEKAKTYLAEVGADEKALFYHTLAVLHAPLYRTENAGALRQDWPRVPLPKNPELLQTSAALGEQIAALLDVEQSVTGVTAGDPQAELREVAVLATVNGGVPDFTVNVGWGHFGAGSAVMPGRGRTMPHSNTNPHPNPPPQAMEGEKSNAVDVYLNDTTYWRNVPQNVWDYTLGGYQVLKKWLSYRETAVLGRVLKPEEAWEFMYIARRIAALLALNSALDTNYEAVRIG